MISCVDVDYRGNSAVAACVLFHEWSDENAAVEYVEIVHDIEPYQPGRFYLRELPCLLRVLEKVVEPLSIIVIDGYVWLDSSQRPGLGAKLYEAIEQALPIIGVAKSSFAGSSAISVIRGKSSTPLFVTSVGIDTQTAAQFIRQMHGSYRIPTLLKRVDSLCRQTVL